MFIQTLPPSHTQNCVQGQLSLRQVHLIVLHGVSVLQVHFISFSISSGASSMFGGRVTGTSVLFKVSFKYPKFVVSTPISNELNAAFHVITCK